MTQPVPPRALEAVVSVGSAERVSFKPHLELALGASYSQGQTGATYTDFVRDNGTEINQTGIFIRVDYFWGTTQQKAKMR